MTTETKLPAEVEQAIETAAEHIQSLHGGARASHKSLITCHLALVLAEQVKAAGA